MKIKSASVSLFFRVTANFSFYSLLFRFFLIFAFVTKKQTLLWWCNWRYWIQIQSGEICRCQLPKCLLNQLSFLQKRAIISRDRNRFLTLILFLPLLLPLLVPDAHFLLYFTFFYFLSLLLPHFLIWLWLLRPTAQVRLILTLLSTPLMARFCWPAVFLLWAVN